VQERTYAERLAAVRAVVRAARVLYEDRQRLIPDLVRTTGLSPEGVQLGFEEHLEISPAAGDVDALLASVASRGTDGASRVHVILSAGVFVAPLRAIAVARAAAPVVTLHASRRDPVFAHALVEAIDDASVRLSDEPEGADEIHVYGRDETVAEVASRAPAGTRVRRHGAGLGIAFLSRNTDEGAAAIAIAKDVIPFDQRGCLSPRVVFVQGSRERGEHVASAIAGALSSLGAKVPRGALHDDERRDRARYEQTVFAAGDHTVGCADGPILVPPPGRHVHVCWFESEGDARARLAPIARYVVAVGADGEASWAPLHSRRSALGAMQKPPLDGPVDLRPLARFGRPE
jgi:hypothetical protein